MVNDSVSTRILDHIVHLTPPGTLEESVSAFRKLGLTVTPGGTHADGKTANALVVFADGTYLELLHFTKRPSSPDVTPSPSNNDSQPDPVTVSTKHPWAAKLPGWIDYAFFGNAGSPSVAQTINARSAADGSGVRYTPEVPGGRTRTDGRVLEWLITAPLVDDEDGTGAVADDARGRLPFFCGDVTPRAWRVPLEPRSNTSHANTARGIAHVKLLVLSSQLAAYTKQLTTVLGVPPRDSAATGASASSSREVVWELERQPEQSVETRTAPALLIMKAAEDDEEREYVRTRGAGIYELGIVVADSGKEGMVRTPYGQAVFRSSQH
ncbi:glyoxalase-like domain-containing protein [Cubamyces lactineus]|nr:glyoxalase-like domain-containing protein [Cubamyces lactineus]